MFLFILGAKKVKDVCTGQENPVINIICSQQEENFMPFSQFAMESGFAVEIRRDCFFAKLKVDRTFEILWDPLLTILPNLFFWKQLTVRSLQSK